MSSLGIYDRGVLNKFREVFDNSVISESEGAFSAAEELLGEVRLPLISIYREDFNIHTARYNLTQRRRGSSIVSGSEEDDEYKTIQDIPMEISYQIDVWTRRKEDIDKLIPELIFWLIENPNIEVNVEEADHPIEFPLVLEEDVTDNTDIMSFEDKGRIFRMTLSARIDDARLFKFRTVKPVLTTDIDYTVLNTLDEFPDN